MARRRVPAAAMRDSARARCGLSSGSAPAEALSGAMSGAQASGGGGGGGGSAAPAATPVGLDAFEASAHSAASTCEGMRRKQKVSEGIRGECPLGRLRLRTRSASQAVEGEAIPPPGRRGEGVSTGPSDGYQRPGIHSGHPRRSDVPCRHLVAQCRLAPRERLSREPLVGEARLRERARYGALSCGR